MHVGGSCSTRTTRLLTHFAVAFLTSFNKGKLWTIFRQQSIFFLIRPFPLLGSWREKLKRHKRKFGRIRYLNEMMKPFTHQRRLWISATQGESAASGRASNQTPPRRQRGAGRTRRQRADGNRSPDRLIRPGKKSREELPSLLALSLSLYLPLCQWWERKTLRRWRGARLVDGRRFY